MDIFNPFYIDPCNQSTILFECKHPSQYLKLIMKFICLLPFAFLAAHFIRAYFYTKQEAYKTQISFCISIVTYLLLYFWIENAVPFESLMVTDSMIYRLNQIPLYFWFLCQSSYICEVAGVLDFLKIPFSHIVKIFVTCLKWICVFFVVFVSFIILLPIELNGVFFDGIFQRGVRWDSIVFYFIHSLIIVVLSGTFIFYDRAGSMFTISSRKKIIAAIFMYALSLAIDLISFEYAHTMPYFVKLFYEERDKFLYIDFIVRILYYDFPPLVLLRIMYLLSFTQDTDEENKLKEMLTEQFELTI